MSSKITKPNSNGTQKERILHHLLINKDTWTPCYIFSMKMWIMRYQNRIHELRKEGWDITNVITPAMRRQRKSEWKLFIGTSTSPDANNYN